MNITKKFGKKAIAFVLAVAMLVGILAANIFSAAIAFTDVPEGVWYYADVTELASKGVVSGVGNNKFEPNRTVANAEMIKMVVNAFFRSDFNAYEQANSSTMYAYFGARLYWFSFMSYYARQTGLLDGIDVDIRDYASCYQPMTRNDMAMILANAAKAKGIAPTEAQKAAVQSDIKDYASIPAKYQDAVKTCYALKTKNASGVAKALLEGDNGYFYGRDGASVNMTRAEACAVIVRLDNLIVGGGTVVDPDPTPSEPTVPTVKDIAVTTATNSMGTAYHVADNGFDTGKLNNGKEINEANIAELLDKAKTIWPTGMTWADTTIVTSGNNWYANPGTVTRNMLTTNGVWTDANEGCGGFSALISDYLFGKSGNPCHTVTNFKDIRPGDVVVQFKADKSVSHVMIVTSVLQTGQFAGNGVFIAQGNYGKVVDWPDETDEWESYDSDMLAEKGSYVVFSRWPS